MGLAGGEQSWAETSGFLPRERLSSVGLAAKKCGAPSEMESCQLRGGSPTGDLGWDRGGRRGPASVGDSSGV